jgi:hypothetical protein
MISSLTEHTRKCLKFEYLGRIEYDFRKSCVTGSWDHKDSVSAKKVFKKNSCLCTFKIIRSMLSMRVLRFCGKYIKASIKDYKMNCVFQFVSCPSRYCIGFDGVRNSEPKSSCLGPFMLTNGPYVAGDHRDHPPVGVRGEHPGTPSCQS